MILSLGFFRLSMAGPACHLYSQLGYRQHECSSIFVLPVARLRIRSGTHSVAIIFRHLPFRLFLFLQELQSAMSTWKHGILGCCDSGCGYFCVSMYCCAPCTWGKVWSAYDMPGGYAVGCCCGGGMCGTRKGVVCLHTGNGGGDALLGIGAAAAVRLADEVREEYCFLHRRKLLTCIVRCLCCGRCTLGC